MASLLCKTVIFVGIGNRNVRRPDNQLSVENIELYPLFAYNKFYF